MSTPPGPRKPQMLCGTCGKVIEELGFGHSARCPHCGHGVVIPHHIRVECDRCGHTTRARLRELGTERLCAKCSKSILIANVVLTPRRSLRSRPRNRYVGGTPQADAAWAVLILALTMVITLLGLTVL